VNINLNLYNNLLKPTIDFSLSYVLNSKYTRGNLQLNSKKIEIKSIITDIELKKNK